MELTQLLKVENIRVPLAAQDKEAAIHELVDVLEQNGALSDADAVRKAVFEREATRSTGIGDGLAIPHGKTDGVESLVVAFGRTAEPLDFGAIDGKPVNLIWLLSSPPDKSGPHIEALKVISKVMAKAAVRRQMMEVDSAEAMYEVLKTAEAAG
ncbi:MAG: PTS sugar transporter subunit IIA [Planctomycetota bacterium]